MRAVSENGGALHFAHMDLQNDKEIVLNAVSENGDALLYADDSLKKDKDVVLKAMLRDFNTFQYIHGNLKYDKEIQMLKKRIYLPIISKNLEKCFDISFHFKEWTQRKRKFMD